MIRIFAEEAGPVHDAGPGLIFLQRNLQQCQDFLLDIVSFMEYTEQAVKQKCLRQVWRSLHGGYG